MSRLDHSAVAVVFDNGSRSCRVGFAGEAAPRSVFDSIVRRPPSGTASGATRKDSYVGDEASTLGGDKLIPRHPIEEGIVTDWDDMQKLWHHSFYNELRVAPGEQPVLLTEAPHNPKSHRETATRIMFETFAVPAAYVAMSSVLALRASGRRTGIVVDIGDTVAHYVPIYEGCAITHTIQRVPLAGRALTDFLIQLLAVRKYSFTTSAELEVARFLKDKVCYVARDLKVEEVATLSSVSMSYELPDGLVLSAVTERFRCPEALFQPALAGLEVAAVHEATHNAIMMSDPSIRRELYRHVLLAGGTARLPGLSERLQTELKNLAPSEHVTVVAPTHDFAAWVGGAAVAALPTFAEKWITKADYDEIGPAVVHHKCDPILNFSDI